MVEPQKPSNTPASASASAKQQQTPSRAQPAAKSTSASTDTSPTKKPASTATTSASSSASSLANSASTGSNANATSSNSTSTTARRTSTTTTGSSASRRGTVTGSNPSTTPGTGTPSSNSGPRSASPSKQQPQVENDGDRPVTIPRAGSPEKNKEQQMDGDDDDGRSRDTSVRVSAAKQGGGLAWKKEEESAVMKFYGLDNLQPKVWGEDDYDPLATATKPRISTTIVGKRAPIPIISSQFQPASAAEAHSPLSAADASDLVDPLWINNAAYKERRKALSKGSAIAESEMSPSLLITSKNFDPKFFLVEVHRGASYRDIEGGVQRLHVAIDHRTEIMKNLVKTHFAKFVSAKSTIDSFYHEMRNKNLISSEEYGIAPFSNTLSGLNADAQKLYGPMLQRRSKAEKIRIALSVLEQWKFFFALPNTLRDNVDKRNFDAAVRDYKKGKYLMQSSFGGLLQTALSSPTSSSAPGPIATPADTTITDNASSTSAVPNTNNATSPTSPVPRPAASPATTPASFAPSTSGIPNITTTGPADDASNNILPQHYQKVFEKVWAEVERIVAGLRTRLFRQLDDPWVALDMQERAISYLIDLDASTDPMWYYLDGQYKWILGQLMDAYEEHTRNLEALKKLAADPTSLASNTRNRSSSFGDLMSDPPPMPLDPAPAPPHEDDDIDAAIAKHKNEVVGVSTGIPTVILPSSSSTANDSNASGRGDRDVDGGTGGNRGLNRAGSSSMDLGGEGGRLLGGDYLRNVWGGAGGKRLVVKMSEPFTLGQLKKAVTTVQTKEFEDVFEQDMDLQLWKAITALVKNLCTIITTCFPDFWKVCKMFYENKLYKDRKSGAGGLLDAESPVGSGGGYGSIRQQGSGLFSSPTSPHHMSSLHHKPSYHSTTSSSSSQSHHHSRKHIDPKKLELCQNMFRNTMDLYSTLLSQAFFMDTELSFLRTLAGREPCPVSRPLGNLSSKAGRGNGNNAAAVNEISRSSPAPLTSLLLSASSVSATSSPAFKHRIAGPTLVSPTLSEHRGGLGGGPTTIPPPVPVVVVEPPPSPMPLGLEFATFMLSHPLTGCHFATKIMVELVRCFNEVKGMRMGGSSGGGASGGTSTFGGSSGSSGNGSSGSTTAVIHELVLAQLAETVEKIKARCLDCIGDAVLIESKNFYQYEDWEFEPEGGSGKGDGVKKQRTEGGGEKDEGEKEGGVGGSESGIGKTNTTTVVKLFYRFQKFIVRCLYKIASAPIGASGLLLSNNNNTSEDGNAAAYGLKDDYGNVLNPYGGGIVRSATGSRDNGGGGGGAYVIPHAYVEWVRFCFFESMYSMLDGLEWLAVHWHEEDVDAAYARLLAASGTSGAGIGGMVGGGNGVGVGTSGAGEVVGLTDINWNGWAEHPARRSPSSTSYLSDVAATRFANASGGAGGHGVSATGDPGGTALFGGSIGGGLNFVGMSLNAVVDVGGGGVVGGGMAGVTRTGVSVVFGGAGKGRGVSLDVRRIDTRALLVISNLSFMRSAMLPKLSALFEAKFMRSTMAPPASAHLALSSSSDSKHYLEAIDHLDTLLVRNYVRRKARAIGQLVRNGVLASGLDWNDLRKPQEVRPYCHEILLLLVMVHAQVSDVSKPLVRRVVGELLHHLAIELLAAFRRVDRFSTGGYLQATLEVDYLQQTLSSYETPPTTTIFKLILDTLERGVDAEGSRRNDRNSNRNSSSRRKSGNTGSGGSNSRRSSMTSAGASGKDGGVSVVTPEMADSVKKLLEEAKRATQVQFLCFRDGV
ncbi:hypothetical protein HK102_004105 [Quaeritorhiza haematococci]|nr:hypothetical protein HK102_004105 [Quaeritorhiza haematococci]